MNKQVIVVRKDLNMRKGKLAAQVAHASLKVFFDNMELLEIERELYGNEESPIENLFFSTYKKNFNNAMLSWLNYKEGDPGFTKIVVGCNSEAELFEIKEKCVIANIPHAIILDNGITEFGGVKTYTCIAVGPDEIEKIDPITSRFTLL
jgi:PTH2 family peptidyl-tRNA hydrolase